MSELNDFINAQHNRDIEITKTLATIAQSQTDMSARLFGGEGQKGMLPYMIETAAATAKELRGDIKLVSDRTSALEGWRRGSKAWVAGAVAVLSLEGTALGLYFSKISAHVQALTALHK